MGLVMGIDCRPKARLYAFMYALKKHRLSRSRAQIFENGKVPAMLREKLCFAQTLWIKFLFFSSLIVGSVPAPKCLRISL